MPATTRSAAEFGWSVTDGYVEFPAVIEHAVANVRAGADPKWATYLIVHDADAALIGIGGFKGAPVDGMVEIGYAIAPVYRKQGHVDQCRCAPSWRSRALDGLRTVVADTLPEHNASTKVLTRCGFDHVGEVVDPDEGPVWRWELAL